MVASYIFILVAGRLVWRHHPGLPLPSHHAICGTCTQLLPLVEMYCKWELQVDCSNLHSLMVRFDSEQELLSHELGRSLLFMVRDEDLGFGTMVTTDAVIATINPFDAVRERLAAADLAIHSLHAQVFSIATLCCAWDCDNPLNNFTCFSLKSSRVCHVNADNIGGGLLHSVVSHAPTWIVSTQKSHIATMVFQN